MRSGFWPIVLIAIASPVYPQSSPDAALTRGARKTEAAIPSPGLVSGGSLSGSISAVVFVERASSGGLTEVRLGQIAAQRAASDRVKQFATLMISDHGSADAQLAAIAARKNLHVAQQVNSEHQKTIRDLEGTSNQEFDDRYIAQMLVAHDEAISLFKSGAGASDPDIAAFANNMLPMLQEHRQMIDALRTASGSTR